MQKQKVILERFQEYSSTERGARIDVVVRIEGPGVMPEGQYHAQGRDRDARHAVIYAAARVLGIHPNDVEIIKDMLTPDLYEVELVKKTEAYCKRGSATITRCAERYVTEDIFCGAISALRNTDDDPRPKPRRAR